MDFRKIGVWAATIFVGLLFLMNGFTKIMQAAAWQERFVTQWGLPAWMVPLTGLAELAGGALILFPRTAMYGGSIIAAVMLGAAGTHLMAGEYANIAVNALFGGLAAFVAWFRCPWRAST